MADGVTLNPGSGGDTIAADDVSSAKYQWIKIATGGDGVAQFGTSFSRIVSTGSGADKTAVKASAGTLYGIIVANVDTSNYYLQLYDVASGSVTVGTTTPGITIPVLASGGAVAMLNLGIKFATAITAAITTTIGGSTSATADKVVVTFLYA